MSLAAQKLKPSDCVLAFGIPTSKEECEDAKDDSLGRDFAAHLVWQAHDLHFVSYLKKIEPYFVRLGVKIVHKLTLKDYGSLFRDSSNKVVILFSHWKEEDDTVEFFDGMAAIDEIVNVIPNHFDRIVDLTVCHPEKLVIRIRNHLPPTASIRYAEENNTPAAWLYFYWAVFTILNDSNNSGDNNSGVTYLEALEKSVEEFRKNYI